MRCPNCGAIASHIITDVEGNTYYRCMAGLTAFPSPINLKNPQESRIVPCDTLMNSRGRLFNGTIAYRTGGKVETLTAVRGKIHS